MALSAIHSIQPNVYDGGTGTSLTTRSQAGQVYGEMSYPPPPQNLVSPDTGLPHSELPGAYGIPSQSESSPHDGSSNWTPQRSFSTPDGMSMADQPPPMTPGEKKRNKLGYHRTSVACSKYHTKNHLLVSVLTPQATVVDARSDVSQQPMMPRVVVRAAFDSRGSAASNQRNNKEEQKLVPGAPCTHIWISEIPNLHRLHYQHAPQPTHRPSVNSPLWQRMHQTCVHH